MVTIIDPTHNTRNNLLWLSTAVSHRTLPLAGVGDVVEVVNFACRAKSESQRRGSHSFNFVTVRFYVRFSKGFQIEMYLD